MVVRSLELGPDVEQRAGHDQDGGEQAGRPQQLQGAEGVRPRKASEGEDDRAGEAEEDGDRIVRSAVVRSRGIGWGAMGAAARRRIDPEPVP